VLEAVSPRLVDLGYDITVYCADRAASTGRVYRGVNLARVPAPNSKHFETIVRSAMATLCEFFSDSDILHFHGSGSALLALAGRLTGKKVIVTIHGADWRRRKWNAFASWFLRMGERAAMTIPHATVVVGPALKRALEAEYKSRLVYIPNGVEDRCKRAANRIRGLGLEPDKYVLYLGRLVPEKQCHTLLRAWLDLVRTVELKLVFAGPTWHSAEYVETLRAAAADDPSVVFTGEVDEELLEELYANCMTYVLPSEVEGMSLSLLDAMAFGACIICSDIAANADVVGDAGITVRVADVESLTAALTRVTTDADLRQRLGGAARERLRQEFSWDVIAKQWDDLYRRVLDQAVATPVRPDTTRSVVSSKS
jgi:glycosyltransferase involved in cell wall biosynthesis